MRTCFVIFLFLGHVVSAQHSLGVADIINYSKQDYHAGTQSWDVKQDKNGILYFANNDGLLTFDGNYWRVNRLPSRTHMRCIEIGSDNRVYMGSQDDIGYFTPGANGKLEYQSLKNLLPAQERSLSEIWDVVSFGGDIFFRSDVKILQLKNNRFIIHRPATQWRFMGNSNGVLLAQDRKQGLYIFDGSRWHPAKGVNKLPVESYVSAFLPLGRDSSLLVTTRHGLFVFSGGQLLPFSTPSLAGITDKLVFGASLTREGHIALATRLNGCYIIDRKGNLLNHFSIREGLQNSNVYNVFSDKSGNLWLCLDNGIDFIAYNNPIQHIYPEQQNNGSGYTSIIHKGALYLGSSNGLFRSALPASTNIANTRAAFEPVQNTSGQVWNLTELNGQLLLAHHEGAFTVEGTSARQLSNWTGFWSFKAISSVPPSAAIVAGNYRGVSFFKFENNQFKNIDSNLIFESSRFLAVDNDAKTVWIGHPYKGIFKLQWDGNNQLDIKQFTPKNAPLGINNNFLYKIRNEILLTTEKGIYQYNRQKESFEPSAFYSQILHHIPVSYMREDTAGNIWFVSRSSVGVIDRSGRSPKVMFIPELNQHLVSGFEHINPISSTDIIIGGEKGFYHLDFEKYKNNKDKAIRLQLSAVSSLGAKDSLLFGGYFQQINDSSQVEARQPRVKYENNSLHFEYASTLYGQQSNIEFSYQLKGFDKEWSAWNKKTEKDYTNLPAGQYTFQVKCRNGEGYQSNTVSYVFRVLPPWYQTRWAMLLYIFFFMGVVYAIHRYQKRRYLLQQKRRLEKQQEKHQEEQRRLQYEHQLELEKNEKEIIQLKNQNLQTLLDGKNAELASNAMSLVQKGELLSKIKEELVTLKNNSGSDRESKEFKKVIGTINKELEINNDWDKFAGHFDEVHTNFLTQLKKNYPSLTASELKLCAYLRLNLSSKEIAQLLNISVRGVETSRYRVRKKFGLTADKNLFDVLFGIGGEGS